MATLKDLIKTETLKVGSNASMPSGSRVQIKQGAHEGSWGEITRYVSPSDGYVQVTSLSVGTATGAFRLDGDVGKTTTVTPSGVTNFIPVRRGVTVHLLGANLKSYDMIFLKTIGGGKNPVAQLIRRVVPCLRSIYDQCLSRTVDHIRACQRQLGLYTKRQRLTLMRRSAMSLKRTVGVQSKRTVRVTQHMLSAMSRWSRSRLQQVLSEVGGLACLSKRRRAVHTCIALQQATEDQRRLPWSYSHTLGPNLCFGGASHG